MNNKKTLTALLISIIVVFVCVAVLALTFNASVKTMETAIKDNAAADVKADAAVRKDYADELNQAKEQLETKITELREGKIGVAEFNQAVAEIQATIDTLATKEALSSAQAALDAKYEEANTNIAALQDRATALETQAATLATKADVESQLALKATKEELAQVKSELTTAINDLKTNLEGDIQTIVSNAAALAQRVTTLEELKDTLATKEALSAVSVELSTAKAELNGKVAELVAAQGTLKETLEGELAEAKTALEEAIAGNAGDIETLQGDVDALEARVADLETAVQTFSTKAELAELAANLEEFTKAYISHDGFYHITMILSGDAELSEEEQAAWDAFLEKAAAYDSKFHKDEHSVAYENLTEMQPFSFSTYSALEYLVPVKAYYSEVLQPVAERMWAVMTWYLSRASKFEQVEEYFNELVDTMMELETIEETFHRLIEEFEQVTVDTITEDTDAYEALETLKAVYAQTLEIEEIAEVERYAEDVKKYNAILEAAKILQDFIDDVNDGLGGALTDDHARLIHKAEYVAAKEAIDAIDEAEYFGEWDEEKEGYELHNLAITYFPEGYGKEELFKPFLEKLGAFLDRIVVLEEAASKLDVAGKEEYDEAVEIKLALLQTETKPLFNEKFAAIHEEFAEVTDWADAYELEDDDVDDNLRYIYRIKVVGHEFKEAEDLEAYVTHVEELYDTYFVESGLVEKVAPFLVEDYYFEYSEKAALEKVNGLIDAAEAAIEEDQFKAMLAYNGINYDKFKIELVARIEQLEGLIAELADRVTLLKENYYNVETESYEVTLDDYAALFDTTKSSSMRSQLKALYTLYGVEGYKVAEPEVLTHNRALSVEVETIMAELVTLYEDITKGLREAAENAMKLLTEDVLKYPLIYADEIEQAIVEIGDIIEEYKIADRDIALSVEGDIVNFSDLLVKLGQVETVATYTAIAAQAEYDTFDYSTHAIKDVDSKSVKLDEIETVKAAYDSLMSWAASYLGEENYMDEDEETGDKTVNEEKLVALFGKVQKLTDKEHFEINGVEYKFWTLEEVAHILACHEGAKPVADAAAEAWAATRALLEAATGIDPFTYHDKPQFDEAYESYAQFRVNFYGEDTLPDLETAEFLAEDEKAVYSAFKDQYDAFNLFYDAAEIAWENINSMIDDLSDNAIMIDNIDGLTTAYDEKDGLKVKVDAILLALETFNNTYDKVDMCNEKFGGEQGNMLKLTRAYACIKAIQDIQDLESPTEAQLKTAVEYYKSYIARYAYMNAKTVERVYATYSTYHSLFETL